VSVRALTELRITDTLHFDMAALITGS